MVRCFMLPRPQQHLNNRECRRSAQGVPPGCQTAGCGGPERQPGEGGGRSDGEGDSGIDDNDGA